MDLELGPLLKTGLAEEEGDGELDFAVPSEGSPSLEFESGSRPFKPRQKKGKNEASHERRKNRREKKVEQDGRRQQAKAALKYVAPAQAVTTSLELDGAQVATGAYVAKNSTPENAKIPCEVQGLLEEGFTLISWDGW